MSRYQIVHNNPEHGNVDEPYFEKIEDAQREAWFWIWDCEKKCKVQEFEKDWSGQRF